MTLLFLMGIDIPGLFVVLFVFTGFGLGFFLLCRYIFKKLFRHFSEKRIVVLSILSMWILVPLFFILLYVILVQFPQDSDTARLERYYENLEENYLNELKEGMTKMEVIDLMGENDTTKNIMVYDLSLPNMESKYILTIEFEKNRAVNFTRTGDDHDDK